MGREMPVKGRRRRAFLSLGGRRRSARLAAAAAVRAPLLGGQLKQQTGGMSKMKLKQEWAKSCSGQPAEEARLEGSGLERSYEDMARLEGSGLERSDEDMAMHASVDEDKVHHWSHDEEAAFVEVAWELAPSYESWSKDFYRAIADALNEKCGILNPDYVKLDWQKVMRKHQTCVNKLNYYKVKGMGLRVHIGELKPFSSGRSASGRFMNSSAYPPDASSGAIEDPNTDEHDIQFALEDIQGKVEGDNMLMYATLLNHRAHLDVFWAHGGRGLNIKQKISYLDEAIGFRNLDVPLSAVKQQDRNVYIKSKRAALKLLKDNRPDSKPVSNLELFVSSCLLEDKVVRDVVAVYDTHMKVRGFLLREVEKVLKRVLGASSACQLSQACDY